MVTDKCPNGPKGLKGLNPNGLKDLYRLNPNGHIGLNPLFAPLIYPISAPHFSPLAFHSPPPPPSPRQKPQTRLKRLKRGKMGMF